VNQRDNTCVSVLTPNGRGAVAVVAVSGPAAVTSVARYFQAANGRPLADQPIDRIVYGHWGDSQGEDLIVCRRDGKAQESKAQESATLEIHCHGGHQSSAQIVTDLTTAGCITVEPDQWLAERNDSPLSVAAHLALAKATTLRTATILLDQYHGALQRELEIIDEILNAELTIGNFAKASVRLERLLKYADLGHHLTQPWRVVIAGQPNVGKSSLINALVGYERAIVFDQPGTTRDVVSSTTAIDGWPVQLSDTAGLHRSSPTNEIDPIETAGIALARQQLAAADLIVWVLDAVATATASDRSPWDQAQQQAQAVGVVLDQSQTLIVINKIDLAPTNPTPTNPAPTNLDATEQSVNTSAVTGTGIQHLLATLAHRLAPSVPPPGAAVPFAPEQIQFLKTALNASHRQDPLSASSACNSLTQPRFFRPAV